MRVAVGKLREDHLDEDLAFCRQIGAQGVVLNRPLLAGNHGPSLQMGYYGRKDESLPQRWDFMELLRLRTTVESYGLELVALENTPPHFYDHVMVGGPRRDEQLDNYCETIRNMGRAGIGILGYHFMPNVVWRTSHRVAVRGGARSTGFDAELVKDAPLSHGRRIDEAELWDHYTIFIQTVLPVAEPAGVRLALHPDDPPVPEIAGVARLFRSVEAFDRALRLGDSPNHGLDLCMGTWSEMGVDVPQAMRHFGAAGKIFYVHFRDVEGTVPVFHETFLGDGNVDLPAALSALREVGFEGYLMDDHVPELDGDSGWGHRGKALAVGYISGMLRMLESRTDGEGPVNR